MGGVVCYACHAAHAYRIPSWNHSRYVPVSRQPVEEFVDEDKERFDRLPWPQQVRYVANVKTLQPMMMRHIVKHGDPAARMALALRNDLPGYIRGMLNRDVNPQVRRNLGYQRNGNGLAVEA